LGTQLSAKGGTENFRGDHVPFKVGAEVRSGGWVKQKVQQDLKKRSIVCWSTITVGEGGEKVGEVVRRTRHLRKGSALDRYLHRMENAEGRTCQGELGGHLWGDKKAKGGGCSREKKKKRIGIRSYVKEGSGHARPVTVHRLHGTKIQKQ